MDTDYRVTLLENFVYGGECLDGLNIVSEGWAVLLRLVHINADEW